MQCVFHSIRFKVNKGWSKALLLFLCLYVSSLLFLIHDNIGITLFLCNSGKLSLVPYTKDFGRITHF
ncbi:hypothetical protein DW774_13515 [Bacteroides ovatus]|nr:hypothetical protein DW774_13515 [Bacteroides ovatus]